MNPQPRIDVVKFNGINNFGMWRCEVMDALNASNLEDTLRLEKNEAQPLKKSGRRWTDLRVAWSDRV